MWKAILCLELPSLLKKKSQAPHFVLHVYFHSFHAIFYYFTDEASSSFPFFQLPGGRWKLISFPFSLVFLPPFLPLLFFFIHVSFTASIYCALFLQFFFHRVPLNSSSIYFCLLSYFFMSLANYFTPLYP